MGSNMTEHVTIEKTSKRFKAQHLVGLALLILGPIAMVLWGIGGGSIDFPLWYWFLPGLAWLLVTKIRVWWSHG